MEKLVIIGAGESGVGAAILGKQKGYRVFVSDNGKISEKHKQELLKNRIKFEENRHTVDKVLRANTIIKSPGISDKILLIQKIRQNNIPIISEIEFASRFTDATIIGITGTNGKTTTAILTHEILKKAEFNVCLAGNIGNSFAKQVAKNNYEVYVLELSSFQLNGIKNFNSHIAIITNIAPDHLDRYDYDFSKYIDSKFKITKNQKYSDYLIYDADNLPIQNWLKNNKAKAKLIPFSIEKKLQFGATLRNNKIVINLKKKFNMPISSLSIKGKHNVKNAMASTMAVRLLKAKKDFIKESLENFEGVEHRLEKVAKINSVEYINDSKATNINATFYALECMDKPTIWIAGGVDKGNDYTNLLPLVREKVKAIVCLGIDNEKIKKIFSNVVSTIVETAAADEAVKLSHKLSEEGDTILLSPACASFDLFEDYRDRGHQFKKAVYNCNKVISD